MTDVLKESRWSVDVSRTIAGLREAADKLADAGVPSDAQLTASSGGDWLHVEASYTYFEDDDEDDDFTPVPDPVLSLPVERE